MDFYSKTVNQLIEELSRLPGIGAMLHTDRSGAMSDL